ncbi:MAG: serine/threonine protein kinase [Betaproteobacteria bacterium]
MELDDLRSTWQAFGRELERHNDLVARDFRARGFDRLRSSLRSSLRPLACGQLLQIVFGVLMILLGIAVWTRHRHFGALLASGVTLHVYGVATVAMGGIVLGVIRGIDYGAPVLVIQKRLARLRRLYVVAGLALGLAWWVLWVPLTLAVFDVAFGADLYANIPGVVAVEMAAGLGGIAVTWMLLRWMRRHARFADAVDASLAGSSLARARAQLAEIAAFERP